MKTLGLIGGTSWVSTVDYYKAINQLTNERLGGSNFAKVLLYSINFDEFRTLADINKWDDIARMFADLAQKLQMRGLIVSSFALMPLT
jgi:aspartate racemase